jgi:TfoX/Sxy family transcriptional regulator of competence genes
VAVDEALNERVREILGDADVTEKRMFSGTCFLLNGNMLCAVNRERMMFRVGKDQNDKALERGATPVEMRGRKLGGFVWVKRELVSETRELKKWLEMARGYVEEMPKKAVKRGRAPVR